MNNFVRNVDMRSPVNNPTYEERWRERPYYVTLKDARDLDARADVMGGGLLCIYRLARKFCAGRGLDIGGVGVRGSGSNFQPLPGSITVDNRLEGSGSATDLSKYENMDYVFCSHCLEHVQDPERAVEEFYRVLRLEGVLFIYSPHPSSKNWDPNLRPRSRVHHWWQPTPASLSRILLMTGFKIEYMENEPDNLHSFLVIGRK